MAELDARIEQFKKMAEADPQNELGHFSLGRAYLDAGRYDEAMSCFNRVIDINANMSKAYQLKAEAQRKQGNTQAAVETLTRGVQVAHSRGDLMPKNDMIRLLQELGAPIPETAQAPSTPPPQVGEGQVLCSRCGQLKSKMPSPTWSHASGKEIQEKVCADCWREWIGMGTKVINELRLPLADPQAQRIFDQHMREFLNLK